LTLGYIPAPWGPLDDAEGKVQGGRSRKKYDTRTCPTAVDDNGKDLRRGGDLGAETRKGFSSRSVREATESHGRMARKKKKKKKQSARATKNNLVRPYKKEKCSPLEISTREGQGSSEKSAIKREEICYARRERMRMSSMKEVVVDDVEKIT